MNEWKKGEGEERKSNRDALAFWEKVLSGSRNFVDLASVEIRCGFPFCGL